MFDVEWCSVKCGGMMRWGARCNGNVLYIPHLTTTAQQYFTSAHFLHSTPAIHLTSFHISRISFNTTFTVLLVSVFHITPCDQHGVMWNTVWCGTWCDVQRFAMPRLRCGMLCLIHPNVAVMWNKVRCRICATRCDAVMSCKINYIYDLTLYLCITPCVLSYWSFMQS